MGGRTKYWAGILALVVLAIYFLVFHKDPFPANHEAIGIGDVHILHDAIGVVLLVGAFLVWRRARRAPATT